MGGGGVSASGKGKRANRGGFAQRGIWVNYGGRRGGRRREQWGNRDRAREHGEDCWSASTRALEKITQWKKQITQARRAGHAGTKQDHAGAKADHAGAEADHAGAGGITRCLEQIERALKELTRRPEEIARALEQDRAGAGPDHALEGAACVGAGGDRADTEGHAVSAATEVPKPVVQGSVMSVRTPPCTRGV